MTSSGRYASTVLYEQFFLLSVNFETVISARFGFESFNSAQTVEWVIGKQFFRNFGILISRLHAGHRACP